MYYTVIHSSRKTLALQIKNGELIVRAPKRTSLATIECFVAEHERWIQKHLAKAERQQAEAATTQSLSPEELCALTEQARRVFAERVAYFAPIVGVDYEKITVRHQSTRWGSCTARGNLNFNCLLLLAPPEVLDSIVVHELCHRKEMNHSPRFYAEVYRVLPNYDATHAWPSMKSLICSAAISTVKPRSMYLDVSSQNTFSSFLSSDSSSSISNSSTKRSSIELNSFSSA